jgi:hypothetical protein
MLQQSQDEDNRALCRRGPEGPNSDVPGADVTNFGSLAYSIGEKFEGGKARPP